MFEYKCEKCGGLLIDDILATAQFYDKETSILIDEDGNGQPGLLPDYMIFRCQKCGYKEKRSFEQVKLDLKLTYLHALLRTRQLDAYEGLDRSNLKEENGMSYCGICPGPVEGDGYCYNDIKAQCAVRGLSLGRKNGAI